MGDFIEIYDTEILLIESQYGDVIEMVGSAIIVMPSSGGGSGGAVNSVNGKSGTVILSAADVGADVAGSAQTVSDALQPQITVNTDAVAMLTALLSALQSAKADVTYVNAQIATLVGTDTQTLAAIQAISDALAENEDLLSALDQTVANRVRFDVATQGLTALQKYNARTNIGAEEAGTAALLIGQITAASIGAVTTAQLANVAFSGSYNDLSNKPTIPVLPTLATVATTGSYTDLINQPTNGTNNYLTQAALLAYTPTVTGYTAKALDTKKVWYWNGSAWVDTGLSELDQAKVYVDDMIVVQNKNLYKQSNNVTGVYVNSSKNISANANAVVNVLPVEAGKTYAVRSTDFNPSLLFIALRETNSAAVGVTLGEAALTATADPTIKTFSVPSGSAAKFAFINLLIPSVSFDIRNDVLINEGTSISSDDSIVSIAGSGIADTASRQRIAALEARTGVQSKLTGKKWCVIGDSITQKNYRSLLNYHDYVSSAVGGMTIYNYGSSGTGYFNRTTAAANVTQTDIDLITVFLGTNDWGNQTAENQKPLGAFLDTGTTTISGCINTLLTALIAKFPLKTIAIITPLPRKTNWGSNATANDYGYTLEQLSNLIIQYAKHYSLPYFDLYHESNLPVWDAIANDYYFKAPENPTPDGLHPNDEGHKVIARKLRQWLEGV